MLIRGLLLLNSYTLENPYFACFCTTFNIKDLNLEVFSSFLKNLWKLTAEPKRLGSLLQFSQEGKKLFIKCCWLFFHNEVSCIFYEDNISQVRHKLFESWALNDLGHAWKFSHCTILSRDEVCLRGDGGIYPRS